MVSHYRALPIQLTHVDDAIAYIAEASPHGLAAGDPPFGGHIEGRAPARLIEDGPGWDSVTDAIVWARERARIVLVRIGLPRTYYSAGIDDLPEVSPPRWPAPPSE